MFEITGCMAENADSSNTHDLYVTECGHDCFDTEGRNTFRPNGHRTDYHMLYVARGRAYFYSAGDYVSAQAGTLAVYRQFEPHGYRYYPDDAPEIYWIHFNGEYAQTFLDRLALLEKNIYTIGVHSFISQQFESIIIELQRHRDMYMKMCQGYFVTLLIYLSRKVSAQSITRFMPHYEEILDLIDYINEHIDENTALADYAAHCHINKCYCLQLFKRITGFPPIEYRNRRRIEKAKSLLERSGDAIAKISDMLGFDTPSYFTKVFKKYVGSTPFAYRAALVMTDAHKEKANENATQ